MVYLLHSYFGRDGRDEAEELLERQSGNRDKPRILDAFNEPIENWLDFFMFTMFTDRDGKSQLLSLSESSLDPLSRTTRFMLTEEAHHMFVGETGIARIVERTCQLMKEAGYSEDVRKLGGIDLADAPEVHQPLVQPEPRPARQRDLDQRRVVLRQRPQGARATKRSGTTTSVTEALYELDVLAATASSNRQHIPMRTAMNEVLRDWYVGDCQAGVDALEQDPRAPRHVAIACGCRIASSTAASACSRRCTSIRRGTSCRTRSGTRRKHEWLPAPADREYLLSIMAAPVYEPGKFANYIAPPQRGIKGQPVNFEYVRTEAVDAMTKIDTSDDRATASRVIELNDPPANTYSYEMMREIDAAVLEARMDADVHVIVITRRRREVLLRRREHRDAQGRRSRLQVLLLPARQRDAEPARADAEAGDRGAQRPHRRRRPRGGDGRGHPDREARTAARSACRKSRSACCRAPAARSGWRGWSARRGRSS